MKRWLAIIPLALFGVLVVVAWQQLTKDDPAPASFTSPERPVPSTEYQTLDGTTTSLTAMKGKPYIVNFWATWCTPCKAEHPFLIQMASEGVDIVGVLHKDKNEPAKELLARDGNPFSTILLDPLGDLSLEVGISGVPESFLVNADGQIIKTIRGPIVDRSRAEDFVRAYRAELAKASAPPAGG
ncbi:MAG: DsbE family thiol:disulfide interchange protein [Hyphomonadaceae bacterium]|nr:DsbE family thiol:disulfide interchange protein [Hyphomonadaceae bacterium]